MALATKKYSCDVCEKVFSDQSNRRVHMRTHTKEKPFACKICNKRFSVSSTLKQHLWLHSNKKPYQCDICSREFCQVSNYRLHLRTHIKKEKIESLTQKDSNPEISKLDNQNESKELSCESCSQTFSSSSSLVLHRRTHLEAKPFECLVCNKTFTQRSNMKVHMKIHTNYKKFSCDKCDMKFVQKIQLQKHLESHEKLLYCSVCGKKFRNKSKMLIHTENHKKESNETHIEATSELASPDGSSVPKARLVLKISIPKVETFSCGTCQLNFSDKTLLESHNIEAHQLSDKDTAVSLPKDTKTYKCMHCSGEFSNKADYKIHCNTHQDEKKFSCKSCGKRFRQSKKLDLHMNKYVCKFCPEKFCRRTLYESHAAQHKSISSVPSNQDVKLSPRMNPEESSHRSITNYVNRKYSCETCCETFSLPIALYQHKQTHNQRQPKTSVTKIPTPTSSESIKDNIAKVLECPVCFEVFPSKSDLELHFEMHPSSSLFFCQICTRTFVQKWICDSHMMNHIRETKLLTKTNMVRNNSSPVTVPIA